MKIYELLTNADSVEHSSFMLDGEYYTPVHHRYTAPYERDDYLLALAKENKHKLGSYELQDAIGLGLHLYANAESEYNYFAPGYELFSKSQSKTTHTLPDLNSFLLEQEQIFPESTVYNHLFNPLGEVGNFQPPNFLSLDYFEEHAHIGMGIYNDNSMSPPEARLYEYYHKTPEYISKDMLRIYSDVEHKRELFPFFGKLVIEGLPKSQLASLFEVAELERKFVDFLIMHRDDNDLGYQRYQYHDMVSRKDEYIEMPARGYTYEKFLSHLKDHGNMSHTTTALEDAENECDFFESFILLQLNKEKFQNYIDTTPVGTSEQIAFRLERYNYEKTEEALSVHYFFNYEDLKKFQYYDSQVAYDTTYKYVVKVINSLVTLKGDPAFTPVKSLIFLEEHYFQDSFRILDSPPIAPDVELLTYRGVDNKVLILLNSMVDKRYDFPIPITGMDNTVFDLQYQAQKLPHHSPLLFESDDPTNFEIFRMTNGKPSEYSEFDDPDYRYIDAKGYSAAAYFDTIVPNQYYYYVFRAVDVHGFISNPSPIYEFILNKEGETLYPRIRIVDLKPPDPPVQKSRSFKKYVKIGFPPEQFQIDQADISKIDDSLVNHDIGIGVADEKIIGSNRKFKFRFRSKSTGKTIDVNVTFKKKKVIKA